MQILLGIPDCEEGQLDLQKKIMKFFPKKVNI